MSANTEDAGNAVKDAAEKTVRVVAKELDKRLAAFNETAWQAREAVTKNILSLCTALLGATIAFSNAVVVGTGSVGPALLAALWICLWATIASSLASMWCGVRLRSAPQKLFAAEKPIGGRTEELVNRVVAGELPADDLQTEIETVISEEIHRQVAPAVRSDTWSGRWAATAFFFFLLSSAVLVGLGLAKNWS